MPRPRTVDDTRLLGDAMQLFWRKGFANTGIRELEQGLGLKAPSLYNRFGSKEALFQAALAHYIERIVTGRVQRYLQADAPLQGLRDFFDTTYNYVDTQHPPLACLLVNASIEFGDADPLIALQLAEGARRVKDGFRACLARAQGREEIAANADINAWTETLYLALQGLLVTSKAVRDPAVMRYQVDTLFSLLPTLRGYSNEMPSNEMSPNEILPPPETVP